MTGIWHSANDLARQIASSPYWDAFRTGLDPAPTIPSDPFRINSVHDLVVRYSSLQAQPMLVGLRLPYLPEFRALHDSSLDVRRWHDVALRFGHGFAEIIEFLRSRLPGYPMLSVPDLSPSAPRVDDDGFWDPRFPWMSEYRRTGLHLEVEPPLARVALDPPEDGACLIGALLDLMAELRESAAWQRFRVADAALDEKDRSIARQLRREFQSAVGAERLDAIAGQTGMRATLMRWGELESVRGKAVGMLSEYFDAFDAVDELLEGVTAFISHRLVRGEIPEVEVISADWGPAREMRVVHLHARDMSVRRPNELIRCSAALPSLSGVVLLRNTTVLLNEDVLVADGWLLSNSMDIPVAGPY